MDQVQNPKPDDWTKKYGLWLFVSLIILFLVGLFFSFFPMVFPPKDSNDEKASSEICYQSARMCKDYALEGENCEVVCKNNVPNWCRSA